MTNSNNFQFELAFSRNIGWLTPEEQQLLRKIAHYAAQNVSEGSAYKSVACYVHSLNAKVAPELRKEFETANWGGYRRVEPDT